MADATDRDSKVAWVTGAGSGIGRATALMLAGAGWRVALSGRTTRLLHRVAAEIEDAGGAPLIAQLDVGDTDAVEAARDTILTNWGRVDAVVMAAGLNSPKRQWSDQRMDEFGAIVATNLLGPAYIVDAALEQLRRHSGVVVLVSSYSAWSFSPSAGVAYSASKSALGALARTINSQEAANGVRACHMCPGDVDTEFLRLRPTVPDTDARSVMLSPDDVARAITFVLDSPEHVRLDEVVISPISQV